MSVSSLDVVDWAQDICTLLGFGYHEARGEARRHHSQGVRGGAREYTDPESLYAGEYLGCLSLMHCAC